MRSMKLFGGRQGRADRPARRRRCNGIILCGLANRPSTRSSRRAL